MKEMRVNTNGNILNLTTTEQLDLFTGKSKKKLLFYLSRENRTRKNADTERRTKEMHIAVLKSKERAERIWKYS